MPAPGAGTATPSIKQRSNTRDQRTPSKDTISLDVEAYIERPVTIALRSDPVLLAQEEGRAQVMKDIEAFRQEAQHALTPCARPTRAACKRCYFRMAHVPPMWRDFCLLGLVRRQCKAIAFASDVTLWDGVETRVRALGTPSTEVPTTPTG